MTTSRRSFIHGTGLGLLSFTVAGSAVLISPRDARAKGADFHVLNDEEVELIEAFGEALAPGARENGIAHFIDQQLSVDANDLTALNDYSRKLNNKPFIALNDEAMNALIASLSSAVPEGWSGPPAPLFYLMVRSDAVDVVYGTVEGFERLGVPYMPHILPPDL